MLAPVPVLNEALIKDRNFALLTARGVDIPGSFAIRIDMLPGAVTITAPPPEVKRHDHADLAVPANDLCNLFIGRVPFGYTREVGVLLEKAVGYPVFACTPLPNGRCPNQPATSSSVTVRKSDAWAFEALSKRCVVTDEGLLVVPPDQQFAMAQLMAMRDEAILSMTGCARKSGQALVIETRTSTSKKERGAPPPGPPLPSAGVVPDTTANTAPPPPLPPPPAPTFEFVTEPIILIAPKAIGED